MPRIVLLGEPGSGKSTAAREIARRIRGRVVEVSESVIYPMASFSGKLPSEERMLERFAKQQMKTMKRVDRDMARAVFQKISKQYSRDFIAKSLHAQAVDSSSKATFLFTGLRGFENAAYSRLHNDFLVYLDADTQTLVDRLSHDRGQTQQEALRDLREEQTLYRTKQIKKIAHLVIDTSKMSQSETVQVIVDAIEREYRVCKRCVNTARNPAITFTAEGYCHVCDAYLKHFDKKHLKIELKFLQQFKGSGKNGGYDVMVGISGGKDSTATLATMNQMGFHSLAFTFDLGYLPSTTVPRARHTAKQLGTDFAVIDLRPMMRPIDIASYEKTAALYEEPFTLATKNKFVAAYAEGRKHYSVKCKHSPAFVRTCQLCRRTVVRAYYEEARKRGISAIVLGINEWTNLSAAQRGGDFRVSGMRKLQPDKNQPPVYIFHLPFLLQRTSSQTKRILQKLHWEAPKGEDFIESNSNSCLFARSTERMAKRLLAFHPDATRLAREVTVGFITKNQALKALGKIHPFPLTPREVLEKAGILKKKNS